MRFLCYIRPRTLEPEMGNRLTCAFVAERVDDGPWSITPVYNDDWHSDMSSLYFRDGVVYNVNIYCLEPLEHLTADDDELVCAMHVDGDTVELPRLTFRAFSTEQATRNWVAQNGQPHVQCPNCGQNVPVRRYKTIMEGWLDAEDSHSEGRDLLCEHTHGGESCPGSTTPVP